jgi:hypothetical protein
MKNTWWLSIRQTAPILCLASLAVACGSSNPTATNPKPAVPPANHLVPQPAKILLFYAAEPVIARGESVLLCYGVENAKSVRIEPPVEDLKPSFNRCFSIAPEKTAEYKFIATDEAGSEVSQRVEVRVEGVKHVERVRHHEEGSTGLIASFSADPKQVAPGQDVNVCYNAIGADTVKLTPGLAGPAAKLGCIKSAVSQTTTFTLEATKGGKTESKSIEVKVR